MKGARRQNAGKVSPVCRIGMDVRGRFDISGKAGGARNDAVVQVPPHQCGLGFIPPDGTIDNPAKRNGGAFDDAVGSRFQQNRRAGDGKIAVPPGIFLE